MVSVIVATFNEEQWIGATLASLDAMRGDFEVIVADGASTDGTRHAIEAARPAFRHPLTFLALDRPRSAQLNRAAQAARGDSLWFLHADTLVAQDAVEAIHAAMGDARRVGGNFHLRFVGNSKWNRFFTWAYNARRPFGIYYGDSGVFVRREVFCRLGGFKPIRIMDDYEFIRRLEKTGPTVFLSPILQVSDRRWRSQGVFRTLAVWTWIQALYSLGVSAERLDRWYGPVRGE
jgi:rSAM/selenodomain-associated transferase 2